MREDVAWNGIICKHMLLLTHIGIGASLCTNVIRNMVLRTQGN